MKSIVIVFVSLFVIAGCGVKDSPVTTGKGHTFSSSTSPTIKIDLSQDFEYLGTLNEPQWTETLEVDPAPITTKTERIFYLYGQLTDFHYLQKFISIVVLELPVGKQWADEPIRIKKPLVRTSVKLGRNDFQCCIKPAETTDRFSEQYFHDNGITTPKCYMRMSCKRVFGKNVKIFASYYEDVSKFTEFGIDSCLNWYDKGTFNDKQEKYLEGFRTRAVKSINIF